MKKLVLFLTMGLFGMTLFAQNQVAATYQDLPSDIQKYVTKKYPGYSVDKAMQSNDKKGKVEFFDVFVTKGAEKLVLTFDKNSKFIKAAPAVEAAAVPAAAPAAAPVKEAVPAAAPAKEAAPETTPKN